VKGQETTHEAKPVEKGRTAPVQPPRPQEKKKKSKVEKELCVLERAYATKLPVMLYFHAAKNRVMRKHCSTMDKLIFRQKPLTALGRNFHACRIDAEKVDKDIIKTYKVKTAPTLLFLDYEGKVVRRMTGRIAPQSLQKVMTAVVVQNKKTRDAQAKKEAKKAEKDAKKSA